MIFEDERRGGRPRKYRLEFVQWPVGGFSSSEQAYTIPCLALVAFDKHCASHFRFSSAGSCSHRHRSENRGDMRSILWVRLDIKGEVGC